MCKVPKKKYLQGTIDVPAKYIESTWKHYEYIVRKIRHLKIRNNLSSTRKVPMKLRVPCNISVAPW